MTTPKKTRIAPVAVFSLTMAVSAACMFAVQPMAGKMLLPLVGGAPSGWIAALAFFQTMLLCGYLLAHAFAAFSPRTHAALFLLVLLAGAGFLPFSTSGTQPHGLSGPAEVFVLLAGMLAAPFIAVSAASSTLQRLFTVTGAAGAEDPYFLYAASNAGSLAGLLAYPLLIEPWTSLTTQAHAWTAAYALLIALTAACMAMAKGRKATEAPKLSKNLTMPWKDFAVWTGLSFLPSALLTGVTNLLMAEVISAPLIWVLPLALYLAAFIAAFSRRPPVSEARAETLLPYAIAVAIAACLWQPPVGNGGVAALALHLGAFALAAMFCTLRLSARRPKAPGHLTAYYLAIATGGAMGGILNAFVAPLLFTRVIEYPLCMLATAFLVSGCGVRSGKYGRPLLALLAIAAILGLFVNTQPWPQYAALAQWIAGALSVAALLVADQRRRAWVFPVLALIFIAGEFAMPRDTVVMRARNFFGTVKVYETGGTVRYLMHGTTLHGVQLLGKKKPTARHTYYIPIARLMEAYQPMRIAVIGLGVGTVNCHTHPKREFTYIEIDPAVIDAATNAFDYLSRCVSARPPRVIAGDGRMEMQRLEGEKFDLILVDAFSSDAIPTHLLTKEALELYKERLTPGGVIAMNITNRYFNLRQPLSATAAAAGMDTWLMKYKKTEDPDVFVFDSTWVFAGNASRMERYGAQKLAATGKPWTDDYTNLLSALEF